MLNVKLSNRYHGIYVCSSSVVICVTVSQPKRRRRKRNQT